MYVYVTIFGKINHLRASTEIHFWPVPESYVHSCTIQKYQAVDNRLPGLLLQTAFYRCCVTTRVHFMVLRGINRTVWGTKLLLTTVLTSFVDCISLCHTLKAQHCSLVALTRLRLPTRPRLPAPSSYPPTLYRLNL